MLTVARVADLEWLCAAAFDVSNAGQEEQRIGQSLAADGSLFYCLSFYARASSRVEITGERRTSAGVELTRFQPTSDWQRFQTGGRIAGPATEVHFSLAIPAGVSVEIAGLQAEAQIAASAYKPTYSQGGVYGQARFAQDELRIRTDGANNHSTTVRITANARRS
jgi:hypothetical protein